MSNRKLYMLKVASARLRNLKLQERKYKGALVKRACMHLLIKYAATDEDWDSYRKFGETGAREADEATMRKIDWNRGFWGTPLGKMLRPFFETAAHREEYIRYLTQYYNEKDMDEALGRLGVDPSQWAEIKRRAIANRDARDTYVFEAGRKRDADAKARWEAENKEDAERDRQRRQLGIDRGWISADDNKPSARRFYYDDNDRRFRSTYLTDTQAIFDPEYNRRMGIGTGGNVTNNYYYGIGPDGKPIAVPAGATPAAATPAASGDDPALPGLSTVLDPSSNPVLNPSAGPGIVGAVSGGTGHDPSAITLTAGPLSGGSGSVPLTIDPFEVSRLAALPTPEPSKFDSAVDKGTGILHTLADPFISDDRKADIDARASDIKKYVSGNPWLSSLADSGVDLVSETANSGNSHTNPL